MEENLEKILAKEAGKCNVQGRPHVEGQCLEASVGGGREGRGC